jgi:cytochrome P450
MSSHLEVPGPRGFANVRTTHELLRAPLSTLEREHARYGDYVRLQIGPFALWSVLDPDAVHHVLVGNAKNYHKSPSYRALAMVLGNGLVTSEGETWKRNRKLSQPAFHHRALSGLAETMGECTDDLLAEWDARGDGAKIDAHADMMGLTMRIVGKALFGAELGPDRDQVYDAMTIALERADDWLSQLTLIPTWLPLPQNLRFRRAMKTLDGIVYGLIERRRNAAPRADLLGLLMAARDDDATGMSDRQLRDEVMTLFVAGHETVANALSWAWVSLARHPDVERRLHAEVAEVLGGRTPSFEDLPRLQYTGWVIDEVMRLYPPAWIIERQAIDADVLEGRPLRAKTLVSVCTFLLHRHPGLWPHPERFDPERFSPERAATRHRYAYIPFGAGPRICIGNAFAKMEATIVLAGLVQRWQLELPERPVGFDPRITLRPAGGVPATLVSRSRSSSPCAGK